MSNPEPLKAVLAGCGGMGKNQASILRKSEAYDLQGVCDIDPQRAEMVAQAAETKAFGDFQQMLDQVKPHVVAICTGNDTHAALTIQAARAGVRAVYCEKPMATHLLDARRMVQVCEENDVVLVVNHQRRIGPDLVTARKLIEQGALGPVEVVRANTAGDVLSDATHTIDSLQFLFGDPDFDWVMGQVHRDFQPQEQAKPGRKDPAGMRYGHVVETGAIACWQIKNGPRVELFSGDMRLEHRIYQDYEIFGQLGRLWRPGDKPPNLFISDHRGGTLQADADGYPSKPTEAENAQGLWRQVDTQAQAPGGIPRGYDLLAEILQNGGEHPMAGRVALKNFEILIGIYESARLQKRLAPPIDQDRFPLELMIEQGRL